MKRNYFSLHFFSYFYSNICMRKMDININFSIYLFAKKKFPNLFCHFYFLSIALKYDEPFFQNWEKKKNRYITKYKFNRKYYKENFD